MAGGTECKTKMYLSVHGDSNTVPKTLPSSAETIRIKSMEQGSCVTSVYQAIGSPKDQFTYCSTPGATDSLPTCGESLGFSNTAAKHIYVCNEAQKIHTSAKSLERPVNPIEPLRYFEPYTIST